MSQPADGAGDSTAWWRGGLAGRRGDRRRWTTRYAPVPSKLGRGLLGIYAWTAAGYEVAAAVLLLLQSPRFFSHNPYYWTLWGLAAPAIAAGALRRLPVGTRYALLGASLLGDILLILATVGMTPTWVLLVLMLVTLSAMIFGPRAGIAAFGLVVALSVLAAQGWVRSWLPVASTFPALLDLRLPEVWARLLGTTGVGVLGVLFLVRYVLRGLYQTLEASNAAVLDLVAERERRERAAGKLREAEEKFEKAFRSGPDPMTISELETGRYLDVNEGFERVLGYSREEAVGRTSVELGTWPTAEDRKLFVARLRREGIVCGYEVERVTRLGGRIVCLLNAERVTLGGVECIIAAERDITGLRKAESERIESIHREMKAHEEFTRRLIGAQETERRRIAAELHDSLGQNLLLVKNRAQMAIDRGEGDGGLRGQLESIRELAAEAIAEVRRMSHDLQPHQLDQLGLTRALRAMLEATQESAPIRFDRRIEAIDDAFSPDAAVHFYRIVQECLNNILKHSGARRAQILVERDLRQVRLRIEDDGCGFDPAAGAPGMGLHNIMERARILGGEVRIDAKPGSGTRMDLVIAAPESPSGWKSPD